MSKHEIVVVDADEQEIRQKSAAILSADRTDYFEIIRDDRHLEECAASIREINGALKFISSVWDYACSEANRLHKKFTLQRRTTKDPFEYAKRIRTSACGKYVDARDAAARLERDKIKAVAQAEAEVAQAEQVVALTESGDTEAAKAVRDAPVAVYVPPSVAAAKPVGVGFTKHWKARVINAALVPDPYKIPDLVAIGKFAREHKDKGVMPGVEFYCE